MKRFPKHLCHRGFGPFSSQCKSSQSRPRCPEGITVVSKITQKGALFSRSVFSGADLPQGHICHFIKPWMRNYFLKFAPSDAFHQVRVEHIWGSPHTLIMISYVYNWGYLWMPPSVGWSPDGGVCFTVDRLYTPLWLADPAVMLHCIFLRDAGIWKAIFLNDNKDFKPQNWKHPIPL